MVSEVSSGGRAWVISKLKSLWGNVLLKGEMVEKRAYRSVKYIEGVAVYVSRLWCSFTGATYGS